ncbi:hypothetical protein [Lactococcus lactis]|uniref:hypothetical protein n=1 Tax=Lactococcus lactis TaxID=1358 RepID=UPI0022E1CDA8|nr:hypothetical protein [Lactococcus lactis]
MKKQILATSFAILLLSVGITVNADDSVVKVSAIQGESNFSTNIPETPVLVNFSDITNTSSLINGSFTFTASLLNKEFTLGVNNDDQQVYNFTASASSDSSDVIQNVSFKNNISTLSASQAKYNTGNFEVDFTVDASKYDSTNKNGYSIQVTSTDASTNVSPVS